MDVIRSNAPAGTKVLQEKILEAVSQFTKGMYQTDDMTFVLIGAPG